MSRVIALEGIKGSKGYTRLFPENRQFSIVIESIFIQILIVMCELTMFTLLYSTVDIKNKLFSDRSQDIEHLEARLCTTQTGRL